MNRRRCIKTLALAGLLGPSGLLRAATEGTTVESVDDLPKIKGTLTLYLGRGEGGLYEDILDAIRQRNPALDLQVRRGPSSALANTIVAEAGAGVNRADVFWAIDSGSIGRVVNDAKARPLPSGIRHLLKPAFRFNAWAPISGRIRTLPFNPARLTRDAVPPSIMDLPGRDLKIGWAPAYGAFQSFVTAMRLLEGEAATEAWLRALRPKARSYAGEFGVVMAVSRGEVDLGLANHYYTLRLKKGRPDASLDLAFTQNDAGCLLNTSGAVLLSDRPQAGVFVRHLLTREVQRYLTREAYEIPLVDGIEPPVGLPAIREINPPTVDLEKLADLRPTLDLLRETRLL
ncbi:MAG: substrate-binding domain-containing protein [Opitutaceae bacterium]